MYSPFPVYQPHGFAPVPAPAPAPPAPPAQPTQPAAPVSPPVGTPDLQTGVQVAPPPEGAKPKADPAPAPAPQPATKQQAPVLGTPPASPQALTEDMLVDKDANWIADNWKQVRPLI